MVTLFWQACAEGQCPINSVPLQKKKNYIPRPTLPLSVFSMAVFASCARFAIFSAYGEHVIVKPFHI
jgi:hypothetical protein